MLWYLLSPIRGTTAPPRLPANHPVRIAFYRHGKTTAQHWLVVMMVSVAIAMGFSYPSIFLADNPVAGHAAYPNQAWTTAKPIEDGNTTIDVELRQIWIHGSYMEALDKRVLHRALKVQQSLIPDDQLRDAVPAMSDQLRAGTLDWGFHSPLMYWNNSEQILEADLDILNTINSQKPGYSSLNVVLRPASVLAGKRFSRSQLLAADALVITLMNHVDNGAGSDWQEKMKHLKDGPCQDCLVFPHDGNVVYEFSFMPLSIKEHLALGFAYGCMAVYVLVSFRRMKAFHSRFGLVVTAITQMTCSILASFTICGILKINLSTIPQNAYPFVVLVLGVENMFRLINAVLAYSPTMQTELRIANALGDIGPLSVAAAAQNLAILSLLSTVVSPGVAAFCAFAAIATLFDAFFLLTFFVAVLNVDITRLELQDALTARHTQIRTRHRRRPSPSHPGFVDAMLHGRLPFSTRMAGTLVTTTFILSLNYHFFEHNEQATNLRQLLGTFRAGAYSAAPDTYVLPSMNATLSPDEWMQMQDFSTAKEVMHLAKPGAASFVISVYAPLAIVISGADRTGAATGATGGTEAWAQALRSFAIHHFYPVAVAIVFIVAFVVVLMNFLLYNQAGDEDNDIALEQLEDFLSVQEVTPPHKLDIVKMASNESGHMVTISLDRTIAISVMDRQQQAHHSVAVPSNVLSNISWPVHHLAICDNGEWIALHCADDRVLLYNSITGSIISRLVQYPDDHPAVLFGFYALPCNGGSKLHFITLTSGARLAMSCLEVGTSSRTDVYIMPVVAASIVDTASAGRQLVVVTEDSVIISHSWTTGQWVHSATRKIQDIAPNGGLNGPVSLQLYSDLETERLVLTATSTAYFLNSITLDELDRLDISGAGTRNNVLLVGASRTCQCGNPAFRKLAVSGEVAGKDESALTVWTTADESGTSMCLTCKPLASARKDRHVVSGPGAWSGVRSQAMLGIRKNRQQVADETTGIHKRPTASQLRQRRHARHTANHETTEEQWEAYKLLADGDMETLDVSSGMGSGSSHDASLHVNNPGPVVSLDAQAIAVAFGNTVKVAATALYEELDECSMLDEEQNVKTNQGRHETFGIPQRQTGI